MSNNQNRYLIVVAHADDEILGCGATIAKIQREKLGKIRILYLTNTIKTRKEKNLLEVSKNIYKKYKIEAEIFTAGYVAQSLKFQEHYKLVNFIEKHIQEFKPTHIFTHHPNDIHTDHREVSQICTEAFRYPQRQIKDDLDNIIRGIYFISVKSSTDWCLNHSKKHFYPNIFEEVNEKDIITKVNMLREYQNVVRKYPHPRSETILIAELMTNGSMCGKEYAEGFELGIKIGI